MGKICTQVSKYTGYLLWKGQCIKLQRQALQIYQNQCALNLKNVKIQSQILFLHRTIKIISDYSNAFSDDLFMAVLNQLEQTASISISR